MSTAKQSAKTPIFRFKVWLLTLIVIGSVGISISTLIAASDTLRTQGRPHVRDLGITIGQYQSGNWNAITDVSGVKVAHVTIIEGEGDLHPGEGPVRTGVTVVIPRDDIWHQKVPAGAFILNGTGEMTGLAWIAESGFLEYPIALTNTLNVPRVADGVMSWMIQQYPDIGIADDTLTPVVAECDDSRLNDSQGRHVLPEMVVQALDSAVSGPMEEGAVGAGTGMVSYHFKGGIGTASRIVPSAEEGYRVGVLVNANHGRRHELMMNGIPVGILYDQILAGKQVKQGSRSHTGMVSKSGAHPGPQVRQDSGSIIIIIATDAPLDARQLERLARRAAVGLARTGSISHHGSGDFILAFSTGNVIPHYPKTPTFTMTHIADTHINPLFQATVEATEEAILNALLQAMTMIGRDGRRYDAIDIDILRMILSTYSSEVQ